MIPTPPNWQSLAAHPVAVEDYFPLTEEEYQNLKNGMATHGYDPSKPVALWDSLIIDGVHRHKAAKETGMVPTFADVTGFTLYPETYALLSNAHRRQMSQDDLNKAFLGAIDRGRERQQSGRPAAGSSNPTLHDLVEEGQKVGAKVGQRTLSAHLANQEADPEVAQRTVREKGGMTPNQLEDVRKAFPDEPDVWHEVQDRMVAGEVEKPSHAIRDIQRRRAANLAAEYLETTPLSHRFEVHNLSLSDLIDQVEPESVDYIITDPPYPKDLLWVWEDLREFAIHSLKEGGMLIALSGSANVGLAMERLEDPYLWHRVNVAYLERLPNGQPRKVANQNAHNILTSARQLLVYHKVGEKGAIPDYKVTEGNYLSMIPDEISFTWEETPLHPWQQSLGGFEEIIALLVRKAGSLTICDPCLCSGTTGIAALKAGHYFIGSEPDETSYHIALGRLQQEAA